MSTNKTETQRAIVRLRELLGLSQEGLARELGVSRLSVARWEGQKPPIGPSLWRLYQFAVDSHANEIAAIMMKHIDRQQSTQLASFRYPVSPEIQALKDLRIVAECDPERRKLLLPVLKKLRDMHREMMKTPVPEELEDFYQDPKAWDNTQRNLEWEIKHEEEESKKTQR
jgi:transcriptional regulator with XRE-family HTH domain